MFRQICYIGIVFSMFLSSGCSLVKEEVQKSQYNPNSSRTEKQIQKNSESNGTSKEEADKKIELLIRGIQNNDSKLVVALMNPHRQQYYGAERAKAAIADFKILFKDSLNYQFLGQEQSQDSRIQLIYSYKLYNGSGREKRVQLILMNSLISGHCF